jgi:hypothetical protein
MRRKHDEGRCRRRLCVWHWLRLPMRGAPGSLMREWRREA